MFMPWSAATVLAMNIVLKPLVDITTRLHKTYNLGSMLSLDQANIVRRYIAIGYPKPDARELWLKGNLMAGSRFKL